ncbi:MAG: ABC transporter ATP-binding protein [Chloroflexota bacterium]|nr:ABC transporter ATP-binding protein [Chloroflexota bacterium]
MSQLKVENLSRNFGGLLAVNDVSFVVDRGERLAIIGPNGAGKTTLFNLLSGEIKPSRGKVFLEERDVTFQPPAQRAQLGMGRTFQRNNLFPGLTVYQNVQLAVQQRMGITTNLFRPAETYEELHQETCELLTSLDLDERAEEIVKNLSYGDQRLLEVTLALAIQPRLLLLDEPTAGMSPAETAAMTRMIAQLPQEITVLIIEHDMDVVFNLADHIIVLHHGEVIANGTPQEVKGDPRVQDVYLGVDEELRL